jgi:predicted glycoside hydrolase/deacetylase ChbG (UPF0249 family)
VLVALHADDLGFSPAITEGICAALRHGLLTGASVLANAPAATAALDEWRRIDDERRGDALPSSEPRRALAEPAQAFDLGVHLNLSQGMPLTGAAFPAALLDRRGAFAGMGTFGRLMLPGGRRHAEAVRRELATQIEFVLDHGVQPVRLDGHQYCELMPLVGRIVHELAARYRIPGVRVACEPGTVGSLVRCRGAGGIASIPGAVAKRLLAAGHRRRVRGSGLRHAGLFFGSVTAGRVGLPELERFLAIGIARGVEVVEVGLHPAAPRHAQAAASSPWVDPLAATRPQELRWLIGSALPQLLARHGVRLGRLG